MEDKVSGIGVIRAVEGKIRAGQNFYYRLILYLIYSKKYYQNEPKFKGVYSRNNLPKIKDGVYVKNLGEYVQINRNSLDSFACEWY